MKGLDCVRLGVACVGELHPVTPANSNVVRLGLKFHV